MRYLVFKIMRVLEGQEVATSFVGVVNSDLSDFKFWRDRSYREILNLPHSIMMALNVHGCCLVDLKSDSKVVTASFIVVSSLDVVFLIFGEVYPW